MALFGLMMILTAQLATAGSPSPPNSVDAETAAYYRRALPQAHSFAAKTIDERLLSPADRGNTVYFQVLDDRGNTVGFVREFSGPVSTAGLCPCNPLVFTLVFTQDLALKDVLTRAPLQKYGHAPMTADEQQHLIALAKNPPPKLLEATRGEDMLDATTGATRQAYAPMVVRQAALSTQRVVSIVQDTRDILRGAPADDDRRALGDVLTKKLPPARLARELAALIPRMHNADLQVQAYHYLAGTYLELLQHRGAPDAQVEERLLAPHLLHDRGDDDIAQVCYAMADAGGRPAWVRKCVSYLETSRVAPPYLTLLRGTERFSADEMNAALPLLQEAAGIFRLEQLPMLHWRLAKAAQAVGRNDIACRVAQDLFVVHPMLPKLGGVLGACEDSDKKVEALRAQSRQMLLRSRRPEGPVVQAVNVIDAKGSTRKMPLQDADKVTVAVFFATWCPHCRAELPRINDYVASLSDGGKKVQVLGIRTAIDKETQTYKQFVKEAAPKFPIYSDQADSTNFATFAQAQHLPMALPCVAVIDRGGVIRYILEPGDWRDTQRELEWAVQSLL